MRRYVFGFSQEEVCKLRRTEINEKGKEISVHIDILDLAILKVIGELSSRPSIKKVTINDKSYAWIAYDKILEDLPLLDIKKQALADRIDKLQSFGLVEKITEKIKGVGTFTYIRTGKEYENLLYKESTVCSESVPVCSQIQTGSSQIQTGSSQIQTKDSNTIQYNDTNKENKEELHSSKKKETKFDVREDLSYVDEEFKNIWNEWLDYKDEAKIQYNTQRGAIQAYSTLKNYSDNNPIYANAIVKKSIECSWRGFFALSDKQKEFFNSDKSPYKDMKPKREKGFDINRMPKLEDFDYDKFAYRQALAVYNLEHGIK